MSDNLTKTALDGKLIALQEPHEVEYWTKALGVSEQRLRNAVEAVGPSAEQVRNYLKG